MVTKMILTKGYQGDKQYISILLSKSKYVKAISFLSLNMILSVRKAEETAGAARRV